MITVVLVKPQVPGNIGFIARAMANFDIKELILIEPLCNHLEDDAIRQSKHAKNILKKVKIKPYDSFFDIKKEFDLVVGTTSIVGNDYNIPRTPIPPDEFAKKLRNENVALVFGNEGIGLTNDEIKNCDFIIAIPTSSKYPALNISHATAIIFYEIYKIMGRNKIGSRIEPVSSKEKEIMMKKLNNILNKMEFSTKEKKETQRITWKKIFEKSMMSKREAFVVLGLLRKLENKVNKS